MHLMAGVTGTMRPAYSRQVQTAIMMDTQDMIVEMAPLLARFPLELTRLDDFIAERYGKKTATRQSHPASA